MDSIAGTITGLSASGLVLQNNGGDNLSVATGASSFQFATGIASGASYNVTVLQQPEGLTCTVSRGSGVNVQANVTNIAVACSATTYVIGGTITGLTTDGLVLQNNGGDNLSVATGAPSFQFATGIANGASYNATVLQQPEGLTCTINRGSGANVQANVTNIAVACSATTYVIGGTITGLTADSLVLQNNGGSDLTVAANETSFEFSTPVARGGSYLVTALAEPAGLTCTVSNGVGSNVLSDVHSIQVTCAPSTVTISGTITGLAGSGLTLRNNGGDDLTAAANASTFTFPTPLAYNSGYGVTIETQPAGQTCSIGNASGTAITNVSDVAVSCTTIPTYTVTPTGGAHGSISPSTNQIVNQGATLGFVATPDAGYAVDRWQLDGFTVQIGGGVFQLTNISSNHAVHVTFGQATLTASVNKLALSVVGLTTPSATGNSRVITITNTGSITANGLTVNYPTWPIGTLATSTCGGSLAASSSCTITITPGTTATSGCDTGIAPTPGDLAVSGDNVSTTTIEVVVLNYGCIFQGGYVYSIDDTTPDTGSAGGKVLATSDQASVFWSADSSGSSVDYFAIPGIGDTSTSPCESAVDGACNSAQILARYQPLGTPSNAYAAGACTATIGGYSDWYLPAMCELSYESSGTGLCGSAASPKIQNVQSSLLDMKGISAISGLHWSSTQSSSLPVIGAWGAVLSFSSQMSADLNKANVIPVRCSRALTF